MNPPKNQKPLSFSQKMKRKLIAPVARAVTSALDEALGLCISGIDKGSLHASLLDGCVEFANLTLRPEVIHYLNLPLQMVGSHVSKLKIELSLFNLKTEPLVVELQGVYITVQPSPTADMTAVKRSQLQAHEDEWDAEWNAAASPLTAWLSEAYVQKAMDNIRLLVQDVHIRFEDTTTSRRASWAEVNSLLSSVLGLQVLGLVCLR
jgi:hypothetical protein